MQYRIRQPATSAKENTRNSWDLPLNLQICLKCEALNPKTATHCHKCGHPLLSLMKYSFHLYERGPKAKVRDNWGLPLNLQVCSQCEALNSKTATVCIKCGHSLQAPETATGATAASATTATAANDKLEQKIPDMRDSASATAAATALASSGAASTPDRPALRLSNAPSSSDVPVKQKLRPLGWLAVLALAIAGVAFFLAPSSFQPLPAISYPAKAPDKNLAPPVTAAPPSTPQPVAVGKQDQTGPPNDRLAETALTVPEPTPLIPPLEEETTTINKSTHKKSTQAGTERARISQATVESATSNTPTPVAQKTPPAATPDMRCSEAAQALSLCNLNELQGR